MNYLCIKLNSYEFLLNSYINSKFLPKGKQENDQVQKIYLDNFAIVIKKFGQI